MSTARPIQRPAVPRGKRERTRQRLIETAAHLIREKGYANLSMEQVAAQAGVSRGSIYGNFKDRSELIVRYQSELDPTRIPPDDQPEPG